MSPAKRGLLHSVQDVADAIQNGESDSEIESHNNDASDNRPDEAASEVDKETSNPLTAPPVIVWTLSLNQTNRPYPVTGITG